MALDGASPARDTWAIENDRGLALAVEGDWAQAITAFEAAAEALALDVPMRSATHEPLALVTGNLAHACFRAGRLDSALLHAQRTCTLRVAITGEDGMPVARARMDLAVVLATAGRGEEAMSLVQRAMAAVEHRVGDADVRLAIVLENAARIALALGKPSNAEPLLLRLHALLHAHELSTGRADALLARVADARSRRGNTPRAQTPVSALPAVARARGGEVMATERLTLADLDHLEAESLDHDFGSPRFAEALESATPASSSVPAPLEYAHASIDESAPWEDQPLREAVAVTDRLLRTTPTGMSDLPVGAPLEPPSIGESGREVATDPDLQIAPMWTAVDTVPVEPAAAPVLRTTPSLLSDRAPMIVMPTPKRGARAIPTPARSRRATPSERVPREQAPPAESAGAERAGTPKAVAADVTATPGGSVLPMIIGLVAATAASGGAVWWLLLR
jgi:hypothetical protein